MNIILLIVAVAIFIVVLFAFIKDEKQRFALLGGFLLLVVFGFVYSYFIDASSLKNAELAYSFEHGETLICKDGIEVKNNAFNYDYATKSFMGTGENKGKVVSIGDCKLK